MLGLVLASWLSGVSNLLQLIAVVIGMGLFMGLLIGGVLFVTKHFAEKQRLNLVLLAAWISFVFAVFAAFVPVNILLEPEPAQFLLLLRPYFVAVGLIGIGSFIFILVTLPISGLILRGWRRHFGSWGTRPDKQH